MSDDLIYFSSNHKGDEDDYVTLTPTAQGRLLRKKILPMNGSFIHPKFHDIKIFIDKTVAESLKRNFANKIVGKVQVPAVDGNNVHSEDPLRNLGEVVGIEYDDSGVYATIDARKHAEDFGKTILDSSAFLHMDYIDTETGAHVGPTLIHVAATNRGHVRNMGDYEDIIRASADISDETKIVFMHEEGDPSNSAELTPSTESVNTMTKEEMLAELSKADYKDDLLAVLKASHGVDVSALEAEAVKASELSAQFDAAKDQLNLSASTEIKDLTDAALALSNNNKELTGRLEVLELANHTFVQREAEHEVDSLVKAGKILPAAREAMVKLSLNDRETFEQLVPEKAIVQLSESGVTVHEDPDASDVERINGYVARIQANRK